MPFFLIHPKVVNWLYNHYFLSYPRLGYGLHSDTRFILVRLQYFYAVAPSKHRRNPFIQRSKNMLVKMFAGF